MPISQQELIKIASAVSEVGDLPRFETGFDGEHTLIAVYADGSKKKVLSGWCYYEEVKTLLNQLLGHEPVEQEQTNHYIMKIIDNGREVQSLYVDESTQADAIKYFKGLDVYGEYDGREGVEIFVRGNSIEI